MINWRHIERTLNKHPWTHPSATSILPTKPGKAQRTWATSNPKLLGDRLSTLGIWSKTQRAQAQRHSDTIVKDGLKDMEFAIIVWCSGVLVPQLVMALLWAARGKGLRIEPLVPTLTSFCRELGFRAAADWLSFISYSVCYRLCFFPWLSPTQRNRNDFWSSTRRW